MTLLTDDEIAALVRELRRKDKHGYPSCDMCDLAADTIEELLINSERYLYWRKHHGWTGYFDPDSNSEDDDEIDAAIDAKRQL